MQNFDRSLKCSVNFATAAAPEDNSLWCFLKLWVFTNPLLEFNDRYIAPPKYQGPYSQHFIFCVVY